MSDSETDPDWPTKEDLDDESNRISIESFDNPYANLEQDANVDVSDPGFRFKPGRGKSGVLPSLARLAANRVDINPLNIGAVPSALPPQLDEKMTADEFVRRSGHKANTRVDKGGPPTNTSMIGRLTNLLWSPTQTTSVSAQQRTAASDPTTSVTDRSGGVPGFAGTILAGLAPVVIGGNPILNSDEIKLNHIFEIIKKGDENDKGARIQKFAEEKYPDTAPNPLLNRIGVWMQFHTTNFNSNNIHIKALYNKIKTIDFGNVKEHPLYSVLSDDAKALLLDSGDHDPKLDILAQRFLRDDPIVTIGTPEDMVVVKVNGDMNYHAEDKKIDEHNKKEGEHGQIAIAGFKEDWAESIEGKNAALQEATDLLGDILSDPAKFVAGKVEADTSLPRDLEDMFAVRAKQQTGVRPSVEFQVAAPVEFQGKSKLFTSLARVGADRRREIAAIVTKMMFVFTVD